MEPCARQRKNYSYDYMNQSIYIYIRNKSQDDLFYGAFSFCSATNNLVAGRRQLPNDEEVQILSGGEVWLTRGSVALAMLHA